jgi:hypothetical protein
MKPTQEEMLAWMDNNEDELRYVDTKLEIRKAIRDLIVEHFALREKVEEWQKRAEYSCSFSGLTYLDVDGHGREAELIREIRDFGKEGK